MHRCRSPHIHLTLDASARIKAYPNVGCPSNSVAQATIMANFGDLFDHALHGDGVISRTHIGQYLEMPDLLALRTVDKPGDRCGVLQLLILRQLRNFEEECTQRGQEQRAFQMNLLHWNLM